MSNAPVQSGPRIGPPSALRALATIGMIGSSIAAPGAVGWAARFLRAAFYARAVEERRMADLRLAHGILASAWALRGRRLGLRDRQRFRSAFDWAGGELDERALREGAARLLGSWFPEAWEDPRRRAYGIAFETVELRRSFDPGLRLTRGALRRLDPPRRDPSRQIWTTYPPVHLPDPGGALDLLERPERWPDFSSAAGRFVPVRAGGLEGQTFEIHLPLPLARGISAPTRGYVTCSSAAFGPGPGLERVIADVSEHTDAVPTGVEPLAAIELTTHRGHFMGRAISRLLVYRSGGETFVCDIGSWDPLPPHLAIAYATIGHRAQASFWGPDDPEAGMLAQLALVSQVQAMTPD